jgi:polyhydroxyalkanoate synthesis repressor PhaR
MSEPRVIKKYPNRRLYDTVESRYITLADVQRLVVEKIDFVVVDKKNNADITRSILLQVIAEQEHQVDPILSQDFMIHVIRSYGSVVQAAVSGHLEQSMKQFVQQNPQIRERARVADADQLTVTPTTGSLKTHTRLRPGPDELFKPSTPAAVRMRDLGRDLGEIDRGDRADAK